VKRITVLLNSISSNGTSLFLIQIGDSGGIETTGYLAGASQRNNETTTTDGFVINVTGVAALTFTGQNTIVSFGSNIWSSSGIFLRNDGFGSTSTGTKTTSSTLDRVRITTVNGTDTFDAGNINILYEG
jgi:hypothetical protein